MKKTIVSRSFFCFIYLEQSEMWHAPKSSKLLSQLVVERLCSDFFKKQTFFILKKVYVSCVFVWLHQTITKRNGDFSCRIRFPFASQVLILFLTALCFPLLTLPGFSGGTIHLYWRMNNQMFRWCWLFGTYNKHFIAVPGFFKDTTKFRFYKWKTLKEFHLAITNK